MSEVIWENTKYEWISNMKKLFENWRKHTNEAAYEPGRAVADIDTGEEYLSPEDLMRDEVQDLADKFNVEASVEIASDGQPAILVTHQNGETTAYHDTEEMYQDLSDEVGRRDFGDPDRDEDDWLYEARLPAWERPGNVTPPDDVEVMIPGYGSMMIGQIKRKLATMLEEAYHDAMRDPPHYSHLDSGVIQALHQALKENTEQ